MFITDSRRHVRNFENASYEKQIKGIEKSKVVKIYLFNDLFWVCRFNKSTGKYTIIHSVELKQIDYQEQEDQSMLVRKSSFFGSKAESLTEIYPASFKKDGEQFVIGFARSNERADFIDYLKKYQKSAESP